MCAVVAVYEAGEKNGWWSMTGHQDYSTYILLACVLVVCGVNVYLLRRIRALQRMAEDSKPSVWNTINAENQIADLKTKLAASEEANKKNRLIFKILEASWGNEHTREPVKEAIEAMGLNGLPFTLHPKLF